VQAGNPLIRIDSTDADVALSKAEAELAQAVRQVRTLYADNSTLTANISQRTAEVKRAETDLRKANEDYQRRLAVAAQGAVSGEELQHAKDAVDNARNAYAAARAGAASANEQLTSNSALTDNTSVQQHPNVLQAAAQVRNAYLNKTRCEIVSPVSGMVGKRSVQLGQRVNTGAPLMAVVPLDQVWVDANFKESQLRDVRIGQPVELVADIYGSKIEYKGRVEGFGAATGSAFSLLPAQNATGNWIKIVQRLPVRIALDKEQIRQHPLRIGLSMDVEVNVSDHSGKLLADSSHTNTAHATNVYEQTGDAAQALIDSIIADNLGKKAEALHAAAPAVKSAG
jgi:membrane fusion protein (multidrug efflux system)